ncbi:MAG: mechanosensitive ion channel protein MscS [candidate division Zixibacteria bacterium SM23_73_2]|nr:MAG: mechanosensitive ion channel protein MscS [candidate division Zixibacteria bacterium SM23_73_2]
MIKKIGQIINFPLFHVNQKPISLTSIIMVLVILLVFYLISRGIRRLITNRIFPKYKLDMGIQLAISRIVHYMIIGLGIIMGVQLIGLNLTSLAVVFGLLSVGIGFGLQNIAANFISGLIILFERPIQIGDRITVGDILGDVENISLRATHIRTVDNVTIIVPNSEFISSQVINWSHRDPKIRLHVPVGVAYGSDVPLVIRSLLEVARSHSQVLESPAPRVWFTDFGNSSLNFELLAWIVDPKKKPDVISDLNIKIDEIFRKHEVTIPFPQRDLHLRSSVPLSYISQNRIPEGS